MPKQIENQAKACEHQVAVRPVITCTRDPKRRARLIALMARIEARLAAEKAESSSDDSP